MTRMRVVLLGVALVALGVLVLFFPQSERLEGMRYPCGSAASPADTSFCGTHDGMRFAAVLLMTGGVLTSTTAALWLQVRPSPERSRERSPEPWEPGWKN